MKKIIVTTSTYSPPYESSLLITPHFFKPPFLRRSASAAALRTSGFQDPPPIPHADPSPLSLEQGRARIGGDGKTKNSPKRLSSCAANLRLSRSSQKPPWGSPLDCGEKVTQIETVDCKSL